MWQVDTGVGGERDGATSPSLMDPSSQASPHDRLNTPRSAGSCIKGGAFYVQPRSGRISGMLACVRRGNARVTLRAMTFRYISGSRLADVSCWDVACLPISNSPLAYDRAAFPHLHSHPRRRRTTGPLTRSRWYSRSSASQPLVQRKCYKRTCRLFIRPSSAKHQCSSPYVLYHCCPASSLYSYQNSTALRIRPHFHHTPGLSQPTSYCPGTQIALCADGSCAPLPICLSGTSR